jgi:hypothetical protein
VFILIKKNEKQRKVIDRWRKGIKNSQKDIMSTDVDVQNKNKRRLAFLE